MSQEDIKTMQDAYDAFNRADIPAVTDAMTPDIEWHEPDGGRAPQGTSAVRRASRRTSSPPSRRTSTSSARNPASGSMPATASS
jgi:ketosteroid isomerase-like protein